MVLWINGRQMSLWRAVNDEGEVLEVLIQSRRDRAAALKLMRKLLKKQGFAPTQSRPTSGSVAAFRQAADWVERRALGRGRQSAHAEQEKPI
jgi:transposase-like protein